MLTQVQLKAFIIKTLKARSPNLTLKSIEPHIGKVSLQPKTPPLGQLLAFYGNVRIQAQDFALASTYELEARKRACFIELIDATGGSDNVIYRHSLPPGTSHSDHAVYFTNVGKNFSVELFLEGYIITLNK